MAKYYLNNIDKENQAIVSILTEYLKDNPGIRFGQALFNLSINEFADKEDPSSKSYLLRDIYEDKSGDILSRIAKAILEEKK